MFPLQPNNDYMLDFGAPIPSSILPQQDKLVLSDGVEATHGFREKKKGKNKNDNSDGVINVRKFVHRDIERQRRQEMANLCGSLKTLIPPQHIKGKKSMSDSLQQAANYIKHMQNTINQLKARRDMLKEADHNYSNSDQIGGSKKNGEYNLPNCVTVNPCPDGVEILIETHSIEANEGFPPSRILTELLQRGFNVVSCVSTRADEIRALHRIQLEGNNNTIKDLSGLQERLTYVMNCPW